uniref:Protein SOGA2 n=1 Tax=Trichobilharzia regenti TaxID=157069 RepID=A0AA85J050_TRIRE|nr:unnamed protein product [Trichobilharzia regenti]
MSSDSSVFRRLSLPPQLQPQQSVASSTTASMTTTTATGLFSTGNNKTKKECFTFEPQQWRKSVCKNCFRTQPEHKPPQSLTQQLQRISSEEDTTSTLKSQQTLDNGGSNMSNNSNTTIMSAAEGDNSSYDVKSRDTFMNKPNNGLTGSNAAARAAARKIAVGQRYSDSEVRTSLTGHEIRKSSGIINTNIGQQQQPQQQSAHGVVHSSVSSIDARYVEELENDFFALEDKHEMLIKDYDELNSELEIKVRTISDLQTTLDQYREKVTLLERRCGHLEEEVKSYRERLKLPESDQNHSPNTNILDQQYNNNNNNVGLTDIHCSAELQQRLNEVEQLCQEVMEENEQLKEDVEEMHREIEEMHDHFQEEDRDAVRELQRDLEAANKACRILQFKLRKAERRFEQCEAERANLEERLARLESELYSEADVAHIHNLEEELRVAKEVGVRLNNELDLLDEKRVYYEEENRQLNEELQTSQNKRIAVENELGRLKLEFDKLKNEKGAFDKGPLQVTDKNRSRQGVSLSREASFEDHQIVRDLEAARERETDLSEQLRFAEEEIRKVKRRLKESQAENDILSRKIGKVFSLQTRNNRTAGQAAGEGTEDQQFIPPTTPYSTAVSSEQKKSLISGIGNRLRGHLNTESEASITAASQAPQNAVNTDTTNLLNKEKLATDSGQLNLHTVGESADSQSTNEYKQKLETSLKDNEILKSKLRESEKHLKQIIRDVRLLSSFEKGDGWFEKYNDVRETMKDQENEILRMKKKLSELQEENTKLRANEKLLDAKHSHKTRRSRPISLELMSQELLIEEIKNLEEELNNAESEASSAHEQVNSAHVRITYLEDTMTESRSESDRREGELLKCLSHLEEKCTILNELLTVLEEQNNNLQSEICSLLNLNYLSEDQLSNNKKVDEISSESIKIGDPNQKIRCLEKLLSEEHQRTIVLQKRFDLATKQNVCVNQNSDKHLESKRSEMLQRELDEKEEMIDARDEQINDLKSRVEQMRKMNEAMRALMEKEPTESKPQKMGATVEIASYKKEIDSMRKEMQIIRNNLTQVEKVREKLAKENRELQEELKLREDSIFEQDDELERRNSEIRAQKSSIEQMKRELEQTKCDLAQAKAAEISGASGRLSAKIAEIERLRMELSTATQDLKETKVSQEEWKRIATQNEDTMKHLGNEIIQLRNAIADKDKMLTELHAYLRESRQNTENIKQQCENAETKRAEAEKRMEELKERLMTKEQELKNLRKRMEEAVSATGNNNRDLNQDSTVTSNRDILLNRRGFEVDKLRRELSLTKREKDDLYTELKKLRCKLDKRHMSEERGRKDITSYLSNLNMGNAYAKAIAAQQPTTKINLLNEHISVLNRTNAELKVQNESLHNNVIDYQRRYRSIKEQYEGEQEAWLTERLVLESKAKEQEDRKTALTNTRKLLQDTSVKLFDLEKESEKKLINLQSAYEKLEKEKQTIELKLAQLEDTQKLPKVLQRFSASSGSTRPSVLTSQARTAQLENQEVILKLQNAERIIAKLRNELVELRESYATQNIAAVQEAEEARLNMEKELEDIKDRLLTMECYRQQVELFRHRHFEVEENAEREYKIWQEERDNLVYQAEEARVMINHWSTQIKCKATGEDTKPEDVLNEILKSMEKWSTEHERLPNLKRRMLDSVSSIESTSGIGLSTGATNSPMIPQSKGGLMISSTTSPFSPGLLPRGSSLTAQRSTSMEWTGGRFHGHPLSSGGHPFGSNFRESSCGFGTTSGTSLISGFRGSALSLATGTGIGGGSSYSLMVNSRCGRSVSPEVTVKKITNYPDPTPGFLVRPQSRQGSQDSLASITDYSQKSFTLPGKPPIRSIISPARRMFFEDNRENKSSEIDLHRLTAQQQQQHTPNPYDIQYESTKASLVNLNYSEEKTEPLSKHTTDMSQKVNEKLKPTLQHDTDKGKKSNNNLPSPNINNNKHSNSQTKLNEDLDKQTSTHSRSSFANRFTRWSSSGSSSNNNSNNKHNLVKAHSVEPNSIHERNSENVGGGSDYGGVGSIGGSSNTGDKSMSKSKENLFSKSLKRDKSSTRFGTHDKVKEKSPKIDNYSSNTRQMTTETTSSRENAPQQQQQQQQTQSVVKRSKSVSNISPAIMALRQKFSGGGKS